MAPTRIFGQLRSGALECPACGTVNLFDPSPSRGRGRGKGRLLTRQVRHTRADPHPAGDPAWNPLSQRLRCRGCQKRYRLGIWVQEIAPAVWSRPSPDMVPTPRELAELRREAGGLWAEQKVQSSEELANVLIEGEERPTDGNDD